MRRDAPPFVFVEDDGASNDDFTGITPAFLKASKRKGIAGREGVLCNVLYGIGPKGGRSIFFHVETKRGKRWGGGVAVRCCERIPAGSAVGINDRGGSYCRIGFTAGLGETKSW